MVENIIKFLKENNLESTTTLFNLKDNLKVLYYQKDTLQSIIASKNLGSAAEYIKENGNTNPESKRTMVFSIRNRIEIPNEKYIIAVKNEDFMGWTNRD